ncbi:MAG TPA: hypothetical protein VM513_10340 [Kofleriaceae bacterium]|nr:hypothetical protein [Kofleriaceae bacterium]
MRWSAVPSLLVLVAACGDDHSTVTPDAAPDAELPPVLEPGCYDTPDDTFTSAAGFGPLAPGTLAGWDPNGRWSFTGIRVGGVSSVYLSQQPDGSVLFDGDASTPGTIDEDAVFHRARLTIDTGVFFDIAIRISDLQADGSLRMQRAVCGGGQCRVCTAGMIRAERNAGEGVADGLTLLGELRGADWEDGFTFNVRVKDSLAYVIRTDGLKIIDTSDPANPTEIGRWRRSGQGYSNDLKIVDVAQRRYVIIADSPVDIVDVTDPTSPSLAANLQEDAHTVFTEERGGKIYAYIGDNNGRAPVYDITDPTMPMRIIRYNFGANYLHDLMIDNGIAYLNAWDAGFVVVDFTTPETPSIVGRWEPTPTYSSHSSWATTAGGRKVAVHGEEAYGAHLHVVDIDPASPTFMKPIGEYKTRDHVSIHNVMAFGERAYVTYYQDGVRIFDLSTPSAPRLLGYYNTWDPQDPANSSAFFEGAVGLDVDAARDLVFVADSPRGLLILRDDTN